jgi:hypothetical protein
LFPFLSLVLVTLAKKRNMNEHSKQFTCVA